MESINLSLNISVPEGVDKEKLTKLWNRSLIDAKIRILEYLSNIPNKYIPMNLPGCLYACRENIHMTPSEHNNMKSFNMMFLYDDGFSFSGRDTMNSLLDYDRAIAIGVAKSFPPGTFPWDTLCFQNESKNEDGYFVW